MPSRFDWHSQINSVENEFRANRIALEFLLPRLNSEPKELREGLSPRIFQHVINNLERTFFIRIFAEFEGCLRSYYSSYKKTEPMVSQLIDSIGSKSKMPHSRIAAVHLIRESRNQIIHIPLGFASAVVNLESARSGLQRYVAFLPEIW